MNKIFCFLAVAALLAGATACNTTPPPPPERKPDLSRMTSEERETYEALQRARQRVEEKSRIESAKTHKGDFRKDGQRDPFKFKRNSEEKRKRLGDPGAPVLLNDDSSIFKWRDGGTRSETLHEKQIERRDGID